MKKIYVMALSLVAFSASALAQSEASASTTAVLVTPIAVSKSVDLNFGQLAASGTAGTIVLAFDNTTTATGGVSKLDQTNVAAAEFVVTGEGSSSFSIAIPATITLASGSDELVVDGITCDAGETSSLENGTKTIKIKATLQVPAGAPAGTYTNASDLAVTVNYN